MDLVYRMLAAAGYPQEGIDWLKRHRLAVIVVLALAAWALVFGIGWLLWSILF